MNGQVWIAVLVGLAATIDDLARRQIANWIPVAALAAGLCWNIAQNGWRGALQSLAGAVAGFAVFLIFYLAGGMGAGDIKLMTGFGALLGAIQLLKAAMWTAGVGGVLALCVISVRTLRDAFSKKKASAGDGKEYIPYAPAITLGVWLSLVARS